MVQPSPIVSAIDAPPIDRIRRKIEAARSTGREVINLGQAVPDFPPPAGVLDAVRRALDEPWVHVYSEDPGMDDLREALAAKLAEFNGLRVDPESEILVTAGASQAFMTALLAVAAPGREVILPTPYYFDHAFAVQGVGCRVVEVPLREEDGFQLDVRGILAAVTPATAAVVLVSPNNPTGAVFAKEDLIDLAHGLAGTHVAVISDETYEHFVFEGAHTSPASLPHFEERVITLGGVGKTYGMTGWRVGYAAARAYLVREMLKLQDTMIICAPVIGQVAARAALASPRAAIDERCASLRRRRDHLRRRIEAIPFLAWRDTPGAFFTFPRLMGDFADTPSWEVVDTLLRRTGVAVLPGSAFGEAGEGHLRISFGNVDEATLDRAFDRLEQM